MARLNVTYQGLSIEYPLELEPGTSDVDIRRIAVELVRTGGDGVQLAPNVADGAFEHFVVDRMQNGERIYLRPKVPFG